MMMALSQKNQSTMETRMKKKKRRKEAELGNEGGQSKLATASSFSTKSRTAQPGLCMTVKAARVPARVENGDDPQQTFISYERHQGQQVRQGYDEAR